MPNNFRKPPQPPPVVLRGGGGNLTIELSLEYFFEKFTQMDFVELS